VDIASFTLPIAATILAVIGFKNDKRLDLSGDILGKKEKMRIGLTVFFCTVLALVVSAVWVYLLFTNTCGHTCPFI